jgi:hypothetical protein
MSEADRREPLLILWRFQSPSSRLPKQTEEPYSSHTQSSRRVGRPRRVVRDCRVCPVGKCVNEEENDGPLPGGVPIVPSMLANIFSISSTAVNEAAIEERGMDGKHLVVTCALSLNNRKIPTHALIDCGATGYAFIDKDFAELHQLPLYPLKTPRALEVIDGQKISSGDITHLAEAQLHIQQHRE